MSSILIMGMEMPLDCKHCYYKKLPNFPRCWHQPMELISRDGENTSWKLGDLIKTCPLREIETPHGDLIDRDAIEYISYVNGDVTVAKDVIQTIPAVIEAELHFSHRKGEDVDWKR